MRMDLPAPPVPESQSRGRSLRTVAAGGQFNPLIGAEVALMSRSAASPSLGATFSGKPPGVRDVKCAISNIDKIEGGGRPPAAGKSVVGLCNKNM